MDTLSSVLKSVHLEGAVYLDAEFSAPWCIHGQYGLSRAQERLADVEHVVFFHYLVEGSCKVRLADAPEVLDVAAGDLVLFPHDDKHLMGSDLRLAPIRTSGPFGPVGGAGAGLVHLRTGGGGALTRFVCGYLSCSRSMSRQFFEALPRMLRIELGEGPAAALVSELLRAGVSESAASRPGGSSVLAKVAELLFVQALRRYADSASPEDTGWLAGMRDAHVGRALALLHERPERPWTVEELAREVALSRSALAGRFAALVGEPPMQYLKRWRLAIAARGLRSGDEAISRIAERSGYESAATFSRAFKQEFGVSPGEWRKVGGEAAIDSSAQARPSTAVA